MIFSLEALAALHGDSLLLHFGTTDEPRSVLIDGGPGKVYGPTLKPRLQELRAQLQASGALAADDPLELALAMVSHIDDDHIGGLVLLADDLADDAARQRAPWLTAHAFWLNTFDDVAGHDGDVAVLAAAAQRAGQSAAVLASVPQGRQLRARAEALGWPINAPFAGLVEAPDRQGVTVELSDDTNLLVVAPQAADVERFRKDWEKIMRAAKAKRRKAEPADLAAVADADDSATNLSSIVVLARQGQRSMLLTGDALGDHVRDGLAAADALDAKGRLHVDVLKLPHHGSERNVDAAFFAHLSADHYVISANGHDGNPETHTLDLIAASRPDDAFTIHLTYAAMAGQDIGPRLKAFRAEQERAGRRFGIATRPDAERSLRIDLGDPLFRA